MRFQPVDRVPNIEVGCWGQTVDRWLSEGMPRGTILEQNSMTFWSGSPYFGLDAQMVIRVDIGMHPPFETELLAEDERTRTVRSSEGVVTRSMKDNSSMPTFLRYPVRTREDFLAIKARYDPSTPDRYPDDWDQLVARSRTSDLPVMTPPAGIGLYSMLRRWMGTEAACTVFYDDPALAEEMIEFIVDFTIRLFERVLREAELDWYMWWEDFAFKTGPLVSPRIFRRFMLKPYRRMNDVLRAHGVETIFIDTDGDPRAVVGLLVESGINVLYPLEQCSDGMHPRRFREQYGRDLALWGGIDKRALARSKADVEQELRSKLPGLVEQGGYIPQIDHLAPPDIPYENWLHYLALKREMLS
jgi:uroporphyrinogen decarboxylase